MLPKVTLTDEAKIDIANNLFLKEETVRREVLATANSTIQLLTDREIREAGTKAKN